MAPRTDLASIEERLRDIASRSVSVVRLDEIKTLGDGKLVALFTTNRLLGSADILPDLTTDLMVLDAESEETLHCETFEDVPNLDALRTIFDAFFLRMVTLAEP